MQRVLLIGGEGYIGKVVSKFLIEKNYYVISYDNLIYLKDKKKYQYYNHKNFKFINYDIENLNFIEKLLKNIDSVIILAGLVGDPITKKYPELSEKINIKLVKALIDLLKTKKINKTIFISTCSNYGIIDNDKTADESFELNPLSLYSKAKVDIEKYILNQKHYSNFNPTILRFATAFGLSERMRFDLTVNEFTRDIYLENELIIYDKDTWRPYCHVKDFAKLIEIVLNADSEDVKFEIFNAGGDKNNATKKNIVDMIFKFSKNINVKYLDKGFDTRNYRVNFNKVRDILGFVPDFNIEDGIKEIIEELKINKEKYLDKMIFGNYKIEK